MADEHILSKEELDALLGNGEHGDATAIEGHALGETMRVVMQSVGEALGRLCGADVAFDVNDVLDSPLEANPNAGAYRVVYVLSGEVNGHVHLSLSEEVVTAIAHLVNGGPTTDRSQTSEVLAETMNMAGGVFAETLSDILAADVILAVEDASWVEPGSEGLEVSEESLAFRMAVRFGDMDASEGHVIIPEEVADHFMTLLTDAAGITGEQGDAESQESTMAPLRPADVTHTEEPPTASQSVSAFQPAQFASLGGSEQSFSAGGNLDLLLDVPLRVTVELGRAVMQIRDILSLSKGQVIALDKLAGEPVDVFVNDKLMAKGEVVVMDEHFGVKITHIVSKSERVQNLK